MTHAATIPAHIHKMRSAFNQANQLGGTAMKAGEAGSDGAESGGSCSISTGRRPAIGALSRLERTAKIDRFCFKVEDTLRRRRPQIEVIIVPFLAPSFAAG